MPVKTELRAYGLKASFSVSVADENRTAKRIFSKDVISDAYPFMNYGLNPADAIIQWRRIYYAYYLPDKIIEALNKAAELKLKQ